MMDDTHIADGIAVKLLLAGILLTASVVGGLGLAHVTSQADSADSAAEPGAEPQLAFPINNATGAQMAFPINNVTRTRMAFPINNATALQQSTGVLLTLSAPGQDMDPY